jgi:hypothetical protein
MFSQTRGVFVCGVAFMQTKKIIKIAKSCDNCDSPIMVGGYLVVVGRDMSDADAIAEAVAAVASEADQENYIYEIIS